MHDPRGYPSGKRHQHVMHSRALSICESVRRAARWRECSSSMAGHEAFATGGVADDGRSRARPCAGRQRACAGPLRSGRSAPAAARRSRTPPHRLCATGRLRVIRPSRAPIFSRRRLSATRPRIATLPGSSAVHDRSGSIVRSIFLHRTSVGVIIKRSRRVFLTMMGVAAVATALPAVALAVPCPPDPRLLRNSNPDPMREDCTPSRGLPGNRFQHRLRAGG